MFCDFSEHFITACIAAFLKPRLSSTSTASIVVPAGEHTMSFNYPGCFPVSNTILAEPKTLCAAIL